MTIKVLLINPPIKQYLPFEERWVNIPLSLLNIATQIEGICDVKILDCLLVNDNDIINSNKLYWGYYGLKDDDINQKLLTIKPDIIGISSQFTKNAHLVNNLAKMCKKTLPNATVVLGGVHCSLRYKYLLENDICDYCFIGESEHSFYEFVLHFNNEPIIHKIPGIAYKKLNKIYYTPREFNNKLGELPIPDYSLININEYFNHPLYLPNPYQSNYKQMVFYATKGCPFNCSFCCCPLVFGKKIRYFPHDTIIRNIQYCKDKFGVKTIIFNDDNISTNKRWFKQLLLEFIKCKLDINWYSYQGLHFNSLDGEVLHLIRESGCSNLIFPLESGNQDVLDTIIKKRINLDKAFKVIKNAYDMGFDLYSMFIIGFPGETKEQIEKTISVALDLLRRYNVDPSLFIAVPYFNTKLFDTWVEKGSLSYDITDFEFQKIFSIDEDYPMIRNEDFTKQKLIQYSLNFENEVNKIKYRDSKYHFNVNVLKEEIPKQKLTLDCTGKERFIDYNKFGKFYNVGSIQYSYKLIDIKGFIDSFGEGCVISQEINKYPLNYIELLEKNKIRSFNQNYICTNNLYQDYLSCLSADISNEMKMYYIAEIFKEGGLILQALKVYHAITIFFPKSIYWRSGNCYYSYLGLDALKQIILLCKKYPDLGLNFVNGRINIITDINITPETIDQEINPNISVYPGNFL